MQIKNTNTMGRFSKGLKVAGLIGTLGLASSAQGAVVIEITESGSDLLITTSGSLDTSGLSGDDPTFVDPVIFVNDNIAGVLLWSFGVGDQTYYSGPGDGFDTSSFSNTFSSGFGPGAATLVSGGADFGFSTSLADLWTPAGYVSGSTVSQVLRVTGESFASLGINDGEFAEFSWTSAGGGDSIRMQAGAVPEPSSSLLVGLGGLALILRRRR